MAEKKELDVVIPERKQQPDISDYDVSVSYRWDTAAKFDAESPTFKHIWKKHGTTDDVIARMRQEVVMVKGKRIEDSLGDFLVRMPRDLYDALLERDSRMSREAAQAVTGTDSKSHWETDLDQRRNPKIRK